MGWTWKHHAPRAMLEGFALLFHRAQPGEGSTAPGQPTLFQQNLHIHKRLQPLCHPVLHTKNTGQFWQSRAIDYTWSGCDSLGGIGCKAGPALLRDMCLGHGGGRAQGRTTSTPAEHSVPFIPYEARRALELQQMLGRASAVTVTRGGLQDTDIKHRRNVTWSQRRGKSFTSAEKNLLQQPATHQEEDASFSKYTTLFIMYS